MPAAPTMCSAMPAESTAPREGAEAKLAPRREFAAEESLQRAPSWFGLGTRPHRHSGSKRRPAVGLACGRSSASTPAGPRMTVALRQAEAPGERRGGRTSVRVEAQYRGRILLLPESTASGRCAGSIGSQASAAVVKPPSARRWSRASACARRRGRRRRRRRRWRRDPAAARTARGRPAGPARRPGRGRSCRAWRSAPPAAPWPARGSSCAMRVGKRVTSWLPSDQEGQPASPVPGLQRLAEQRRRAVGARQQEEAVGGVQAVRRLGVFLLARQRRLVADLADGHALAGIAVHQRAAGG